jgi:hypothetical protein
MEISASLKGFKLPEDIMGWKNFGEHKVLAPWVSDETRGKLEAMIFLMNFIDDKWIDSGKSTWLRIFAKSYQKIARYRFKNEDYRFMVEIKIRDLYHFIVSNLTKRGMRNFMAIS